MTIDGEGLAMMERGVSDKIGRRFQMNGVEVFAEPRGHDGIRFHVKSGSRPLPVDCFLRNVEKATLETLVEIASGAICAKMAHVSGVKRV